MSDENKIVTALPFCRKAETLEEVQRRSANNPPQAFQVERTILLTTADYMQFVANLMQDHYILFANTDKMWYEPETKCWHCVLVTSPDAPDGILVESEGFAYARYTAFVQNKLQLALKAVPVQDERPKQMRTAKRREQQR